MSNIAKAAVGALAVSGGGNNAKSLGDGPVPDCPIPPISHFHNREVCETRPVRMNKGHVERKSIYDQLLNAGMGATLVPNQYTTVCPMEVESLENPSAVKGFDTTWIVENTGSKPAVVAWVVDGVEWSPYNPDIKAVDDPKARVAPGEWLNVPSKWQMGSLHLHIGARLALEAISYVPFPVLELFKPLNHLCIMLEKLKTMVLLDKWFCNTELVSSQLVTQTKFIVTSASQMWNL